MKPILWLAIMPFIMLLSGSCGERRGLDRENLERIEKGMSSDPKASLLALDSIDRESLENPDQMLYDLLRIKASDKAFIRHTNAMPIKRVVEYYSGTGDVKRKAESLYYAGRVFADLGDYPEAIKYGRQALNILPSEANDIELQTLKTRVLYNLGFMLQSIREYNEAVEYLNQATPILEKSNDRKRLMYNLELQTNIYIKMKDYKTAENYCIKCMNIAKDFSDSDLALQQINLGVIKLKKGRNDSALMLARGVVERVSERDYPMTLGEVSDIYLKNGILDTAYLYAHRLCQLEDTKNQKRGFQNILETELIQFLPKDSIIDYVRKYSKIMEHFVDKNADEATLMQNTLYNYKLREKDLMVSKDRNKDLWIYIICIVSFAFILGAVIFILKKRNRQQKQIMSESIEEASRLRQTLGPQNIQSEDAESEIEVDKRRTNLRKELLEACKRNSDTLKNVPVILNVSLQDKLNDCIRNNKDMSNVSPLWSKIEEDVLKVSPLFRDRIELLTDYNISDTMQIETYHLALLIKCGFSPTQCFKLMPISKSTVSYRRNILVKCILGSEFNDFTLDDVIRSI